VCLPVPSLSGWPLPTCRTLARRTGWVHIPFFAARSSQERHGPARTSKDRPGPARGRGRPGRTDHRARVRTPPSATPPRGAPATTGSPAPRTPPPP